MQLGPYEVVEIVGSGGFGTVYKARVSGNGENNRVVALKVLTLSEGMGVDGQARLRDEGRILRRLDHPSIVKVEEVVCLEGRWTLVMEYLEGANLTEIVGRDTLPLPVAMQVVAHVADALDYAYHLTDESGQVLKMVHRDIKPSNVQVTKTGTIKVLDFGVARADFSDRESDTGVHVLGSMHYLAPERFEGVSGPESDIYALGVVLFEILVGERMGRASPTPKRHESFLQTVRARLTEVLGESGAGVVELVVQMLAHTPAYRPPAKDVRDRCEKLIRLLEPQDLAAWAREVAGALAKARSASSPQSPDWPERVGRAQWAGLYESTDTLLWSTSGNNELESEASSHDTMSLVFDEPDFMEEPQLTAPLFHEDGEITQLSSAPSLSKQETTVDGANVKKPKTVIYSSPPTQSRSVGSALNWVALIGGCVVFSTILVALWMTFA